MTTVSARQGSYAHDATMVAAFPPAYVTIERIADLLEADLPRPLLTPPRSCIEPGVNAMKPTKTLHDLGQSFWLDNITRSLVNSGTFHRYIEEFSVTGLTSNPTIFDHAIRNSVAAGQCRIPVRPVKLLASRSTCWRHSRFSGP